MRSEKRTIGVAAVDPEAVEGLIERAGGRPRKVGLPGQAPQEAMTGVDGLLATRADASPLIAAALAMDLPVLCTGDGMHALNLALGGAPAETVPGHVPDEGDGPSYHRIFIAPGSKLAAAVGSGGFVRVNSRHSNGLREAQRSPSLMASAYGLEDGVIEALESPFHRWTVGVQFQPQRRAEIPPHFDRLFQCLVQRATEAGQTTR